MGAREANYQVRIPEQSKTEVRQNCAASGCLNIKTDEPDPKRLIDLRLENLGGL
jgi:hypothetical protein